jgi:hypothetical protein
VKNKARFLELLDTYIAGHLLPGEYSELFDYIDSSEYDSLLQEHIEAHADDQVSMANLPPHRAQEIMVNILSSEKNTAELIPMVTRKTNFFRLTAYAAAAVLLVVAGVVLFRKYDAGGSAGRDLITLHQSSIEKRNNASDKPLQMRLEDGTIVMLDPGASLRFPTHFSGGRREVSLEGKAFFSVAKMADRPFYVYYNNIVTHVLGTSFTIRPDKMKNMVQIEVHTGKVEVYEDMKPVGNNGKTSENEMILTPNQRVTIHEESHQFVPSVVDRPMPLQREDATNPSIKESGFVDEPIPHILSLLHDKYGIEILVDNDKLNNCLFTGDIKEESLYNQLDILCMSLNASYEMKGTKILIKGPGCAH